MFGAIIKKEVARSKICNCTTKTVLFKTFIYKLNFDITNKYF